jgi:hypothetical protein
MNRVHLGVVAATLLAGMATFVPSPVHGAEPAQNINRSRHGNLAAAQELSRQAYDRLTAAQQANEFDLAGHAAHAKQWLQQANQEMKLAAQAANRR